MKTLATILASSFPLLATLHADTIDGDATGTLGISPASISMVLRGGETAATPFELSNPLTAATDWRVRLLAADGGETGLAAAVAAFAGSGNALNGPLPNRHDSYANLFNTFGQTPANTLTTSLGALPHTSGQVMESANLGTGGRYATLNLPGLFLFAGDADGISALQVDGLYLAATITRRVGSAVIEEGDRKWSVFFSKVRLRNSSSQLFTGNQLILVDQLDVHQNFGSTLQNQLQRIENLQGSRRIYYAYFATNTRTLLDDDEMLALGRRLIRTAPIDLGRMVEVLPSGGSIGAGASSTLEVRANASGVPVGEYPARIAIESPTGERLAEAPLTIDVRPPVVKTSLDRLHVISVQGGPQDVREIGIEAAGGGNPPWSAEAIGQAGWLQIDTPSGQPPGSLAIRINPSGLAVGTHHETARIVSGNSITNLPVILQIDPLVITQLRSDLLRPQLYALNHATASGSVLVVSAADASITKVIPVGLNPQDATFSPDGSLLYTADYESRTISEIDLTTLELTRWREVNLAIGSIANSLTARFTLAAGKNGIIYHTDSANNPGLKVFHFESGTELADFRLPQTGDGIASLWFDQMTDRLYGNIGNWSSGRSRIFALDVSQAAPVLIARSNDNFTTSSSAGDSILRASLTGDRLFSVRGIFDIPSLQPVGGQLSGETRAISAYGHLRTDIASVRDASTNNLIAEFPIGFPNYPRHSDFTIGQDAVVFFNGASGAFELLPIPEPLRPPGIALVPSPADGGVLDYDSPRLSWTALPMVEGYRVFIGTDAAALAAASAGSPDDRGVVKSLEFLMDPPLPLGTTFYWRVDAIRGGVPVPGAVHQARISPFRLAPAKLTWRLPQATRPQPFDVAVLDGNDGLLGWSATSATPWISLDAPSGAPGTRLIGMIDPSGLPPGIHTGKVVITSGGETRELSLSVEIHALQLVKLAADPARPLVYGLHIGSPVFDESQLLAIDAASGAILKVLAVGRNATDFGIDPVADRIYLNNLNSSVIRVVDLAEFRQLEPLPASNDITSIQADHAGRLFVQHSSGFSPGYSILNAGSGAVLGSVGQNFGTGNRGLLDPVNGLYYVAQNNSTANPKVFDIRTDPPTYLQTINDLRTSGPYPPLLSVDGRYFFWNRRSYRTPQNPQTAQSSFTGDVIATNPDGEIAVGSNQIWWSETGLVAATLPFSSTVCVIDGSGRHLVLFNSTGGTLSSIELASLVALPGPRPVPGATVPHDDFAGLSWPAAPGAQSYHVYFGTTQQSVDAAVPGSTHHLGNVTGNRFDFDPSPAWGYRYYWRIDTVTASGTIKGEVRYFDIPFPVVGDPLPATASSPGTIYLDVGSTLLATGLSGETTSYAIDTDAGSIAFEQLIGGTSAYTRFATSGQEWILRADPKDTWSPGPSIVTSWSRDVFQGHWRQREPITLSSPADQVSNVQVLAADDGHMFAGLSVTTPSGPGKVAAMSEWPRPMVTSRFQASDGAANDAFGSAIAIDGNRVMVGAHGHSSRPGKAYIFEFQPQTTAWVERAKFQPSTSNSDQSGTAVALAGNHAAMSHGWWSSSTSRPVYLYRPTRTGWSLHQSLNDPDPAGRQYGQALAIHDDMLFVAQPGATGVNLYQGIVHVYHFTNGVWTPGAPIMGPVTGSGFANSLAVRDGVLYVSSTNQVHSYQLRAGANRKPRFVSKPPARLVTGRQAALTITATDPDGTTGLVIRSLALPAGMSLTDLGNGSATLGGTPTGPAGSRAFVQWSVSDPAGATTYQGGFIDFIGAGARPVFVRMPASANVGEGQSVHLTASVGNDEAVSWQWFKDGQAIEGAIQPYYIIESATADAAGVYHVTATNEAGSNQSQSATLAVRPPDLHGGPWSTRGNTATRSGHHPATLGRVTFVSTWTRKLADIGRLDLPVIAGNRVFTGVSGWQSGPLLALNLHNGETLWSYPANPGSAGSNNRGAPTWFDGRIYMQTLGAGLQCLDEATGAGLWSVPMSAQHDAYSFPAVTRNGIFHCAGYYGGMYGVETNGNLRFFHTPPAYPAGLAAIHQDRVFTFSSGILYEHRPADGTVIWSLTPPNVNSSGSQTPVIADDCALVIHSGELLCIDIQTRELRWRRSGQFDGTPAIHNGTTYAIHRDGVTAVSLADGMVTKSYLTPARPNNYGVGGQQPLLLNDHLLVSSVNTTWVFRLADGNLVQTIPAGGGILAYSNGHLLVTGGDGSLYSGNTLHAFRANSAPKFSGDIPRTTVASDAAEPMMLALGSFASDPDAGDPLTWSIVSVSRPEVFRTLEIHPQSGDLTVIYNPWESGSTDVVVSITDPVGNVTGHTITFNVPSHPEPRLELAAKLLLNRQSGLYEHAITITNSGAREVAGFDLRITGLPDGVTVNNASGRDGEDWIIHHRQPLAAGASVALTIEYFTPVRGTVLDPLVYAGLVTVPETHPDAPGGGLAVERCVRMEDGTVMIEFASTPGYLYEIHYSDDAQAWKLSPVRVRAAGNRVQWIDSGPPRTETPPSGEPCRFYRVKEIPEP